MKQGDILVIKEKHVSLGSRKALCNADDRVKLIAIHGEILIVELKNNRFSIPKHKIQDYDKV